MPYILEDIISITKDSIETMRQEKIAIFPGTFDPFTLGHESLVKRGLDIVDEIIIAIGVNDAKQTFFSLEKRMEMLSDLYAGESRVSIESYDTLTVDLAKRVGAQFILRGIRSVADFEYEKTIADLNRTISGIETLVLFTEPELSSISSSHVRELLKYNYDVSVFLPAGIKL